MKSARCKDWMSDAFTEELFTLLGTATRRHELIDHESKSACMEARIELVAMIAHTFQLEPQYMKAISERVEDRLKTCGCPMCQRLRG